MHCQQSESPLLSAINRSLALWGIGDATDVKKINIAENVTFLITRPCGTRYVLRVYRPRQRNEIQIRSEVTWINAVCHDTIIRTPAVILGHNNDAVQTLPTSDHYKFRFAVLFTYVDGTCPDHADNTDDQEDAFMMLGKFAATLHRHAKSWQIPADFDRPAWNVEAFFGPTALWGNWCDAPHADDKALRKVFAACESVIKKRLQIFGQDKKKFGLIHADMRQANLITTIDDKKATWIIDFDDCGFGWYLYDCAAAFSFLETDHRLESWKDAWIKGYRRVDDLPAREAQEIDTFIMLRRLALLAWIGSHPDATEPQKLAPTFAHETLPLAQRYLQNYD